MQYNICIGKDLNSNDSWHFKYLLILFSDFSVKQPDRQNEAPYYAIFRFLFWGNQSSKNWRRPKQVFICFISSITLEQNLSLLRIKTSTKQFEIFLLITVSMYDGMFSANLSRQPSRSGILSYYLFYVFILLPIYLTQISRL